MRGDNIKQKKIIEKVYYSIQEQLYNTICTSTVYKKIRTQEIEYEKLFTTPTLFENYNKLLKLQNELEEFEIKTAFITGFNIAKEIFK